MPGPAEARGEQLAGAQGGDRNAGAVGGGRRARHQISHLSGGMRRGDDRDRAGVSATLNRRRETTARRHRAGPDPEADTQVRSDRGGVCGQPRHGVVAQTCDRVAVMYAQIASPARRRSVSGRRIRPRARCSPRAGAHAARREAAAIDASRRIRADAGDALHPRAGSRSSVERSCRALEVETGHRSASCARWDR